MLSGAYWDNLEWLDICGLHLVEFQELNSMHSG